MTLQVMILRLEKLRRLSHEMQMSFMLIVGDLFILILCDAYLYLHRLTNVGPNFSKLLASLKENI